MLSPFEGRCVMAKLHLKDGGVRDVPLVTSAAIGYVATSIEIGARDVRQMRMLFERNPDSFRAFICQLEARFPENRLGDAEPVEPGVQISERQRAVLLELLEHEPSERVPTFRTLATILHMSEQAARLAVRALARKGLAKRMPLFDEMEGHIRGSGYMLTAIGRSLAQEINQKGIL